MSGLETALWVAGGLPAVQVFAGAARHVWTRRDPAGNDEKGLVIFAESIRWLGVRWGAAAVAVCVPVAMLEVVVVGLAGEKAAVKPAEKAGAWGIREVVDLQPFS